MNSAQDGRTTGPDTDERRLPPRASGALPDADELRRFAELLNGDLLIEPPPADDFTRWKPAGADPQLAGPVERNDQPVEGDYNEDAPGVSVPRPQRPPKDYEAQDADRLG